MIEKKQMTVEDFLAVMMANKEVYPEFDVLSDENKVLIANVNICTGTAMSYFKDGRLWGVAGIHYVGIGEGWLLGFPETRQELTMPEFNYIKEGFEKQRDDLKLWRIFATSKISENFLRHLQFKPEPSTCVWNRTL